MTLTPRLIALKDVLARVEGATGADVGLDSLVDPIIAGNEITDREFWVKNVRRRVGAETLEPDWPPYTSSVDACLLLAERVLPGMFWRIGFDSDFGGDEEDGLYLARLQSPRFKRAATPALAFLAAILSTPIAFEEKGIVTDGPGQTGS